MRRLITSSGISDRLQPAADFVRRFTGQEILIVSANRMAADELVRQCCGTRGVAFGVHRFSLPLLAFTIASERLAESGVTILSGSAVDSLAARSVQVCRSKGELSWFDPVAGTPGFFRALGSTLTELRLDGVPPEAIGGIGASGNDVAGLLAQFNLNLEESRVADLAAVYRTAASQIREPVFRFRGFPLLLLDISPVCRLERQILQALIDASEEVLATVHQRDETAVEILQDALGVSAETLAATPTRRALDRLRTNVFKAAPEPGETDTIVEVVSA
jgi:hypothetical protein